MNARQLYAAVPRAVRLLARDVRHGRKDWNQYEALELLEKLAEPIFRRGISRRAFYFKDVVVKVVNGLHNHTASEVDAYRNASPAVRQWLAATLQLSSHMSVMERVRIVNAYDGGRVRLPEDIRALFWALDSDAHRGNIGLTIDGRWVLLDYPYLDRSAENTLERLGFAVKKTERYATLNAWWSLLALDGAYWTAHHDSAVRLSPLTQSVR